MRCRKFFFVTSVAVALVAAGCNKNSSSPTAPQTNTNTAPSFPSVTIAGPTSSSTDPHAQLTVGYAAEVSALTSSAVFGPFTGTAATQNGNTWTWTVTQGTLTVTFTTTKQADGSYTWSWVSNGTDASSGKTYNHWTFLSGNRTADGKSGEWKVFYENTTVVDGDFTWSTNVGGVLTGTLMAYDNTSTLTDKIVVTNNTDKSGEVDAYTGTVLTFKATWTGTGSGTWWSYNSDTQTGTGTWS